MQKITDFYEIRNVSQVKAWGKKFYRLMNALGIQSIVRKKRRVWGKSTIACI